MKQCESGIKEIVYKTRGETFGLSSKIQLSIFKKTVIYKSMIQASQRDKRAILFIIIVML